MKTNANYRAWIHSPKRNGPHPGGEGRQQIEQPHFSRIRFSGGIAREYLEIAQKPSGSGFSPPWRMASGLPPLKPGAGSTARTRRSVS